MSAKGSERRRAPRIEVGGRARGKIKQVIEASLLNISPFGALVEHSHPVVIDQRYEVTFHLGQRDVTFQARAVRSVVSGSRPLPEGRARLVYHTGLEFLDARPEEVDLIIQAVQRGLEGSSGLSLLLLAPNEGQDGWPWFTGTI